MTDNNFHIELRNMTKHELICLIELYNGLIKQFNKSGLKVPTIDEFYLKERM